MRDILLVHYHITFDKVQFLGLGNCACFMSILFARRGKGGGGRKGKRKKKKEGGKRQRKKGKGKGKEKEKKGKKRDKRKGGKRKEKRRKGEIKRKSIQVATTISPNEISFKKLTKPSHTHEHGAFVAWVPRYEFHALGILYRLR